MEETSIKQKNKVRIFEDLMPTTKISDKDVHIDSTILFSHFTVLANFKENVLDDFSYELTPEPTSLFQHRMIWKPNKATLRNHYATKEKAMVLIEFDVCVVYGEAFLHNVKCPKTTYVEVLDRYENNMNRRYLNCCLWLSLMDILMSFLRKCRNMLPVLGHHQLTHKLNHLLK